MYRQRGALTVITPLLMVLVVLLGVMALDGARLFSLRKEMQSQVNAAATAAADAAQACGGEFIALANMRQRALAAARAQGFQGGDDELMVIPGLLEDPDEDGQLSFRETQFIDQTNAVLIRYERAEPISLLLPEDVFGTVTVDVNAAVRKEAVATISAAGGTAGVGGDATLLGAVLGGVLDQPGYTLDPTSLSSLENTTVQLGELLESLGVNNVAELLPVGGDELASALASLSTVSSPLGQTLDEIASASGIETVKVGDILQVVGDASVPESSEFPLYDVVVSLLLNIAKSQQPGNDGILDIPLSIEDLSIPLVANINAVDVGLHVGEAPTVAIGPARKGIDGEWVTRFYAPDVTLELLVDAEIAPINLLGIVEFSLAELKIPLAVDAGGGKGALVSADCAKGRDNNVQFGVHLERTAARLVTGSIDSVTGDVISDPIDATVGRVALLFGLLSIDGIVYINADVEGRVPGVERTLILDPEYSLYCSPTNGCNRLSHDDLGEGLGGLELDITVNDAGLVKTSLGIVSLKPILTPVVDLITGLLETVVEDLSQALINPLLRTLGVGLGGISVTVSGANQDAIQLIENVHVHGS